MWSFHFKLKWESRVNVGRPDPAPLSIERENIRAQQLNWNKPCELVTTQGDKVRFPQLAQLIENLRAGFSFL